MALEDCIIATGPVCRYLVGKPGADFLVQCGLRHRHAHFNGIWVDSNDPPAHTHEPMSRASEPSEVIRLNLQGAPVGSPGDSVIFGITRTRSEVH